MTFEQLLYVQVLAQHRSLQKAADALHISKSGLSTAVTQLERELGIKIFQRDTKGSTLTEQGIQMLSSINEILRSKNSLENTVYELSHTSYRRIHIHYQNTLFRPFIDIFIDHHDEEYPHVSLDISCHELESIIDRVHSHQIDAGFIAVNDLQRDSLPGLNFQQVCSTRLMLLCSEDSPLATQKHPVTLNQLKKQKICLFNDSSHDMIFNSLQSQCGPLELVLRTDDAWAMNQTITRLGCVSFGRTEQAQFSSDSRLMDHVTLVPLSSLIDDHFTLGWLTSPDFPLSDITRQYMEEITTYIRQNTEAEW